MSKINIKWDVQQEELIPVSQIRVGDLFIVGKPSKDCPEFVYVKIDWSDFFETCEMLSIGNIPEDTEIGDDSSLVFNITTNTLEVLDNQHKATLMKGNLSVRTQRGEKTCQ